LLSLLNGFVAGLHFKVVKRDIVLISEFFMGAMIRKYSWDFYKPLVRKVPRKDVVNTMRGLGNKNRHTGLFIGEI
jgi:hypothetical protein